MVLEHNNIVDYTGSNDSIAWLEKLNDANLKIMDICDKINEKYGNDGNNRIAELFHDTLYIQDDIYLLSIKITLNSITKTIGMHASGRIMTYEVLPSFYKNIEELFTELDEY